MHTSVASLFFTLLFPLLGFAGSNSHSEANIRRRMNHRQRSTVSRSIEPRDQATFYEVGQGACGKYNTDSDHVVAMNSAQYGSGENCFKMISITANGQTAQAQIVDECPSCPYRGLDLSPSLFQVFAPLSVGVLDMTWSFVGAAPSPTQQPSPTYTPPPPPPVSVWTPPPSPTWTSTSTTSWTSSSSSSNSTSWSSSVALTSSSPSPTSSTPTSTASPTPTGPSNLGDMNGLVIGLGQLVLNIASG